MHGMGNPDRAQQTAPVQAGGVALVVLLSLPRAHWGVGNRQHWVLDVIFRENLARYRIGDGPKT
jgi:hypothetical protein